MKMFARIRCMISLLLLVGCMCACDTGHTVESSMNGAIESSETKIVAETITKEALYGQYVCEEPGFYDMFTVDLYDDGRFSYYEGSASSYMGGGSWELVENQVILRDVDYGEEWDFYFKVEDECLVFDKNASHGFIYTDPTDGVRFLPMERVDEAWLADLEERGRGKELETIEQRRKEMAETEDERKKMLSQVNQFPFHGTDFEGLLCFDASYMQVDVSMPIWIWVEDAEGNKVWQSTIAFAKEAANDFYVYTMEDVDYLIEYNANSKKHFDMFTLDALGNMVGETVYDVPQTTDLEVFNTEVKKYVTNAKLIIGTTGGAISIDLSSLYLKQ